jgi:farnesyl diphosphate synthase
VNRVACEHSLEIILGKDATPKQLEDAAVLGWCIEWVRGHYCFIRTVVSFTDTHRTRVQLQACFLVADDVMDASVTRRGHPCWYKLDGIGMISINDSFILWSTLFVFLKNHFGTLPIYVPLVDLFNEVWWKLCAW